MVTRVFLPAILAIATIAAASMWIVPEDGDFEALFNYSLLESITAQPVLDNEDLLDRYFQERERYLPIIPPCEREFVQTVGITTFDPDALPETVTSNLIAHICAPALYAYRIYLGEEETASGQRRWFALNEHSEEIWSWLAPEDYDPHAGVIERYPEVYETASTGDPQAMATWEVLQRLYDPARLVIALDVIHQDDAVKYVWAESLYLPEEAPMAMGAGGGGGPPAAPESGGAFEIASIARYGDGLRLTLTNTVAGEACQIEWKQDLLPESVDWTVVASGSSSQTVFDLPMPQYRSGVFRAAQIEEPSVATPEFSPGGGSYSGPTNVVVTCATEGAAIFCTTNGVDPTALDLYVPNGDSIELTEGVTLKARGFHADLAQSAVASATYTIPSTPDASAGDQQILTGGTTNTTLEGSVSGAGPFTITWSKLSGPGSVSFGDASQTNTTASFSQNGIYQLRMIACDGSLCSTDTVIVAVNSDFRAVIDEPEDSSTCSMPTNLLLRATPSGGTATQVAFYADGVYIDAASEDPFGIEWHNVPAGTHELVAIARSFDADNAMIESDPISITVSWTEDVGNFALSVTDLQIPAPGTPIAVTRTYETRYDDSGEVGEKWKLDYEWVKAEKSGSMSSGWQGTTQTSIGCIQETTEHLVTIRLSETETWYFQVRVVFTASDSECVNNPSPLLYNGFTVRYEFVSLTGEGELEAENQRSDIGMVPASGYGYPWLGPIRVQYEDPWYPLWYIDWEPDIDDLLFTAPDGMRYRFHSDGSLRERIDRNDNKLTYDINGITYSHPSNGGAERYVKFTRLSAHITEVFDPNSLDASGQTNGPPAVTYSYDSSGNLTNVARLVDRDAPTYENTAYAYTNATYPSHLTHIVDARGVTNMVNVYNGEGRLQAQYDALDRATTYNADGHRIFKIAGGVTNWYLVDTLNHTSYAQVLEERTGTNLTKVYTYGLDLISQHDPVAADTHYYGYDGNGNTRYLTDEAGAVTDTYVYEAFGTEIASSGSTSNLYRYTGEQYDPTLGFYYLRARYLNAATGRFWTMDPFEGLMKDPATLHKYLYAGASPITYVDPSGNLFGFGAILSSSVMQSTMRAAQTVHATAVINAVRFQLAAIRVINTVSPYLLTAAFALHVLDNGAQALLNNTTPIPAGPAPRGRAIEQIWGVNLGGNFPDIDDWRPDHGLATQVKSHSLKSMDAYISKIEQDAFRLEGIENRTLVGRASQANGGMAIRITAGQIKHKALVVAVPQTDAYLITNPTFRAALRRISESSRAIVRVVPVRGWKK